MPIYEQSEFVIHSIERMVKDGNRNAIPVFGGAALAFTAIHQDIPDVEYFVGLVLLSIPTANRYGISTPEFINSFCALCLVDPVLYFGNLAR